MGENKSPDLPKPPSSHLGLPPYLCIPTLQVKLIHYHLNIFPKDKDKTLTAQKSSKKDVKITWIQSEPQGCGGEIRDESPISVSVSDKSP